MTQIDFPGMTPELQAYIDFNAQTDDGGYEEQRRLRKLVNSGLLQAYDRTQIDAHFVTEKVGSRREHLSPSGKYKLVTSNYETGPNTWSYSQGKVFSVGSDEPLAIVNRNYGAFPFTFIEDHPNGHAYLVCGEDYQGQTVIELDTGKRRDHLPDEAHDGHGFCWADHTFHPETQILVVDGCIWACPYEFRFYDFSDPMSGWTELETEECIDADRRPPSFESDGTIRTYQTAEAEDEDDEKTLPPIAATKTYRREGSKLVLLSDEVTPVEQEKRQKNQKASEEYDAFVENYKATDPLYLRSQELLKDPIFKPADYMSIGITHDTWCSTWRGNERRFCRRIHGGKSKGYTIDLDIAHLSGPVKLGIYKDGKMLEDKFFDHSVEGVEAAFAHAKGLLQ